MYPRFSGKCVVYQILLEKVSRKKSLEEKAETIFAWIDKTKPSLCRGDLFVLNYAGKSNKKSPVCEKFIWTGKSLSIIVDDALPKIFKPIEDKFPLNYWYSANNNSLKLQKSGKVWIDTITLKLNTVMPIGYRELHCLNRYCIYMVIYYNAGPYVLVYDAFDRRSGECDDIEIVKEKCIEFQSIISRVPTIQVSIVSPWTKQCVDRVVYFRKYGK